MPRALLVYPSFPTTFWGFQKSLRFLGLRATHPPLGLLTVAGMLPRDYEVELVDLNVRELREEHLRRADLVLTGGMMIQRPSMERVVERCAAAGVPVVVGGPDATSSSEAMPDDAHLVLGEAESPRLVGALEEVMAAEGRVVLDLRHEGRDIDASPLPRYDVLDLGNYASMALQLSRGCPFKCEFCDIPTLFGKTTRYKSAERMLAELDQLYARGWRGSIFWVDDNFIGNKKHCKALMPAVIEWQRAHGKPFEFYTQASVNLAGDRELLDLMAAAGFTSVFLGIETPVEGSLVETRKLQNVRFDLLQSVRAIQGAGMEVMAGFIVGFDNDPPDIDRHMNRFIEESGIPVAMTGLLTAIPGSPLYDRFKAEGRLLETVVDHQGNNTFEFGFNFETRQPPEQLIGAYKNVLLETYGKPDNYFRRVERLYDSLRSRPVGGGAVSLRRLWAAFRSLLIIPTSRYGRAYGRFLLRTLLRYPSRLHDAIRYGILGVHFHQLTQERLAAHEFRRFIAGALERVQEAYGRGRQEAPRLAAQLLADARQRLQRLPAAVREEVESLYQSAQERLAAQEFRRFITAALERVHEACSRRRQEAPRLAAQLLADARQRLQRLPAAVREEVESLYREAEHALHRVALSLDPSPPPAGLGAS